ncbi:PREDICTED: transcription termination factor 1 [Chrysochloris asiatica]|uniref:Transcription termination factor 1 n=1 Tax=Chrysochloris asiatica TaxID=185453 RepID=A0A9B0T8U7_CHRAS|nr:PREDICTED: transcription termination factor 1 [Chrysochloris asiatica]
MDGKSTRYDIHTPAIKKKKKKHSVDKERHQECSSISFKGSCLANEQSQITKKKKKKKNKQHLISSPVNSSETCQEIATAISTLKKKKKKKKHALGVDKETGIAYVHVNKENIENTPENFRKDNDVIHGRLNKKQKSRKEPEANELPTVLKSYKNESEELHNKVRRKKHKKHHQTGTSCDSQESPHASIALHQSESQEQESLLSVDLQREIPELLVSADKKKSKKKKKKKKISNSPGFEALTMPEGLENVYSEGSQIIGEIGTVEGSNALTGIKDSNGTKRKSKKRKRRSFVETAVGSGADFSVLNKNSENTHRDLEGDDSLTGEGTLIEESMKPRTKKKKTKSHSEETYVEEVQRLESTSEEESNLEPSRHSETCLSEDSRNSDDSDVDLGSAVKQLQEFIPNIKERAATTIKRMYRDDLERFKEFKAEGVSIKFGKFSIKENKQLEENVQEFLSLTGIETADKLLHTDRYPQEKSVITDLKRKYGFRLHIGKGIARPWKLVYYRAKKMFDIHNYKGRYSKGDTEKLKLYHSLHGNDWKKIGEMVARSSLSVALKYSQISSQVNHGTWSKTETRKLVKAVEQVLLKKMSLQELNEMDPSLQENPEGRLSVVRKKLYRGISWIEVEAKVETRNWMQCKSKWMEVLTKRMTKGHDVYRGVNALQAKINLIERLYEINVEDANEIDWEDLASAIG